MQTHAAVCHAAVMMKVELDDRDRLTEKELEASFAALEAVAAAEGKLKEALVELEASKAKHETLNTDLAKAQQELAHNLELVKKSHVVVKGVEVEKFELIRCNDMLIKDTLMLKAEVEKREVQLNNGVFLEEAFRAHPDFDGFVKDFSNVGFKFLMDGLKDVAPDLDLGPIKLKYAEKWAFGSNGTPSPKDLVAMYLKDLDFESDEEEDEDEITQGSDAARVAQDKGDVVLSLGPSSQEGGSQEVDLLASEGELSSHP